MGYADELYNEKHLVGGFIRPRSTNADTGETTEAQLLVAYFKNGKSFGKITSGKGRRIAMHSKHYDGPSRKFRNPCEYLNDIVMDGEVENRMQPRLQYSSPSDNIQYFRDLLSINQELDPSNKYDYGRALMDFANDIKEYDDGLHDLFRSAAKSYITKTRVDRIGWNRNTARSNAQEEYSNLPEEYRRTPANPRFDHLNLNTPIATRASSPLNHGTSQDASGRARSFGPCQH